MNTAFRQLLLALILILTPLASSEASELDTSLSTLDSSVSELEMTLAPGAGIPFRLYKSFLWTETKMVKPRAGGLRIRVCNTGTRAIKVDCRAFGSFNVSPGVEFVSPVITSTQRVLLSIPRNTPAGTVATGTYVFI